MRHQLPYQNKLPFKGHTLSYRIMGKGKPVVLVHGAFSHDSFDGFDTKLSKLYKVYELDFPGFGASDSIGNVPHSIDLFAEALCAFITYCHLEKAPVVAISLGAVVTVKAASMGCLQGKLILAGIPWKVQGIVPVIMSWVPLSVKRHLMKTKWAKRNVLIPAIRNNIIEADSDTDEYLLQSIAPTDVKAIADIDYKKEIEKKLPKNFAILKNEMVFLYGENDQMKNIAHKYLPKFITIPHANHNIFFDHPVDSLRVVTKLL